MRSTSAFCKIIDSREGRNTGFHFTRCRRTLRVTVCCGGVAIGSMEKAGTALTMASAARYKIARFKFIFTKWPHNPHTASAHSRRQLYSMHASPQFKKGKVTVTCVIFLEAED